MLALRSTRTYLKQWENLQNMSPSEDDAGVMSKHPALHATNVEKTYETTSSRTGAVLIDVSLTLTAGQWLCLFGESGSGKTTLLGVLAGLDRNYEGEVELFGKQLKQLHDRELSQLRAQTLGFVFQSFHLLPALDVLDNVLVPSLFSSIAGARDKALDALDALGLADVASAPIQQLSGGQRQRVAVARAIAWSPQMVFCDEPTGQLDDRSASLVAKALEALQREHGTTIVCATHDRRLIPYADRTLWMVDGQCKSAPPAGAVTP